MAATILVDDTDLAIMYSPGAVWGPGPYNSFPPNSFYNNTFHHLNSGNSGGTVQYTFNGTGFAVGGVLEQDDIGSLSYQCSVDGMPLGNASQGEGILCQINDLFLQQHTISLAVTKNQPSASQIRVDYIMYISPSSPSMDLSGSLFFSATSSQIAYQGRWDNISNTLNNMTGFSAKDKTSALSFNFTGRSVTWFSCPQSLSLSKNMSDEGFTYMLDDVSSSGSISNTSLMFSAVASAVGNHQLQVIADKSPTSMTFCGMGVSQNAVDLLNPTQMSNSTTTAIAMSSIISPSTGVSSPNINHSSSASSTTTNHTAIIVGTVIGAAVFVLIIAISVSWIRRRRQRHFVRLSLEHTDGAAEPE